MELLINCVDKHPVVATLHETGFQRGDVIDIKPNGGAWSAAERSNPDWILIRADIVEIEAETLLEGGRPGEPRFIRRLGVDPSGLSSGDSLTREELMARIF